jgi:hypothetical protein
MRNRILLIALGVVVALAAISQFALPAIAESQIEKRLTEGGGSADANLSAFPAMRLLWEEGGRLEIEGSGLDLEIDQNRQVFEKLDGFDEADLRLTDSTVGPLEVSSFELRRSGDAPYSVAGEMTTTGADVADAIADVAGVPGGGILGSVVGLTGPGSEEIPITLEMEMESEDGRIKITDGGGEVAGVPTGPLAELITAAIVVRI